MGHTGSVTAIDFDAHILSLAHNDAIGEGISNISFHAMSADALAYDSAFDFAYARFLLSHLRSPAAVLRKMLNSVKPGGKIIVEDIDFSGHFCFPYNNSFHAYIQHFTTAAHNNGQNPDLGPEVLSLFNEVGITQTGFDVIQPAFQAGPGKWMAWLTLDRIKNTLLEQGIADNATITAMLQDIEAFTNNEQSIISLPRIFRVWGVRK